MTYMVLITFWHTSLLVVVGGGGLKLDEVHNYLEFTGNCETFSHLSFPAFQTITPVARWVTPCVCLCSSHQSVTYFCSFLLHFNWYLTFFDHTHLHDFFSPKICIGTRKIKVFGNSGMRSMISWFKSTRVDLAQYWTGLPNLSNAAPFIWHCQYLCVCVWVCKHRQPRTYICGYMYVQMVANCLLLNIGVCWKKEKIMCTGFGPRFSAEKSYTSCMSAIYTQSVPLLPVVRLTCTSSFSESNIVLV